MNSIQLLKKENATLQKGTKEHKRSELINNLNKEIADQDVVIEALRGAIGNEQKADNAIMEALKKGPARIRVATREELKIEIKNLKNKLLKYEKKGGVETNNAANLDIDDKLSVISNQVGNGSGIYVNNSELILKINELHNQIDDLKLAVTNKDMEIEKYKEMIKKKNQDLVEINQSKVDLKYALAKIEDLKAEISELRAKENATVYNQYDKDIRLQELEMINKNLDVNQRKADNVLNLEFENLQNKIDDLQKRNREYIADNERLEAQNAELAKRIADLKERQQQAVKIQNDELEKLKAAVKEKDKAKATLEQQLASAEQANLRKIKELEEKIAEQEQLITTLQKKAAAATTTKGGTSKGGKSAMFQLEEEMAGTEAANPSALLSKLLHMGINLTFVFCCREE